MTTKHLGELVITKTRVQVKSKRAPQIRSQNTRKKILKMTAKLMATEGVAGLRYANVAKMAKVPQALMGYHFPNVESLLVEVIGQELEKLKIMSTERVERYAQFPKKALESYIRAPFDLSESDLEFRSVFTGFYHLAAVNPTFSEMNSNIRKMGRDRIVNLVTMVLATEGYLMGKGLISREQLLNMATTVQGIVTGLSCLASTEANSDFKKFSDLAVEASFKVLGLGSD